MCLRNSRALTKKLRKDNKESITVYKALKLIDGLLVSPYQQAQHWKPGWIYSDSTFLGRLVVKLLSSNVNRGIHVCLKRESMPDWVLKENGSIVVSLKCNMKDLIAAGYYPGDAQEHEGAVFRKVYFEESEYLRVISGEDIN